MIALTVNCSIGVEKKLLAHSSITPEENRAKRKNILIIVMALVTWLTCRFREGPPKNASLLMMFPPPSVEIWLRKWRKLGCQAKFSSVVRLWTYIVVSTFCQGCVAVKFNCINNSDEWGSVKAVCWYVSAATNGHNPE